jgi:hypothetical protein
MSEGVFYHISIFPLLYVRQDPTALLGSTDLWDTSPTVRTSVCENNYVQRNIRDRGSNLRPLDSDIMMKDPLYQSNYKTLMK